MIDLPTLLVFVPIALGLNLTPGADMLFCLGQGAKSGAGAGVAAAFGIAGGAFLHSLAAGLGLAAIISASPVAFEVIRWAGVAYLVVLAVKAFVSPPLSLQPAGVAAAHRLSAFRDGVLVCLLNPKIALFMLALVPQFVDPERGSVLGQFLVFGLILNTGGTVINVLVGVFAGRMGDLLARNARLARVMQWLTGAVFIGLAAKLALERR